VRLLRARFERALAAASSKNLEIPRDVQGCTGSRGMVAKETLVFIGPDLGHVRVTTPVGRRKGRIDPRRAPFSLLPVKRRKVSLRKKWPLFLN